MGKPTGFLEFQREAAKKRPIEDRKDDFLEVEEKYDPNQSKEQAARCMDCGIPFCHNGCPLGNIIPEFNDAVYEENWKLAYEILDSTNNFPEFTGRICPAPCEASCVLGINKPPVAIEYIEKSIIERAFEEGWVTPQIPAVRTGKKVAVIGSGPAGMAASVQLNKAGHEVTLFERADQIGGLLRYGIPDFKLDKDVVERRVKLMEEEGIIFRTNTNVGIDISASELKRDFDAILLTGGSTIPRNLNIKGRQLNGVHFAMEFLSQQNKRIADQKGIKVDFSKDHGAKEYETKEIFAEGKNVIVIGGGDTGSDCVGTSNRHGAKSVSQIEIMPMPPAERAESTPWPMWPMQLRVSSSHEEGVDRDWALNTKEFVSDGNGNLKAIRVVGVQWVNDNGRMAMQEIPGTERDLPCDLALIAAGFLHPEKEGLLEDLDVELDQRGNVSAKDYQTNNEKVFAAGDMRRGQSLVVWAISEGREAARKVDEYLMDGVSGLEAKSVSMLSPKFLHV